MAIPREQKMPNRMSQWCYSNQFLTSGGKIASAQEVNAITITNVRRPAQIMLAPGWTKGRIFLVQ